EGEVEVGLDVEDAPARVVDREAALMDLAAGARVETHAEGRRADVLEVVAGPGLGVAAGPVEAHVAGDRAPPGAAVAAQDDAIAAGGGLGDRAEAGEFAGG